MAKTIHMRTPQQEKEARLVAGMYDKDRKIQSELYAYCSDYFWANCQGLFFADDDTAMEIFQNTFITFWEKIEQRKIYVSEGRVMGKDDEPLRSSILTYFIGIAKNKYKEWVKKNPSNVDIEASKQQYADMLYDSEENKMLDIIADIISRMSERCSQILTKFYVEGKNLDIILMEIPTIESKNSLKTKKYKCTELLRESARDIYKRYLNS